MQLSQRYFLISGAVLYTIVGVSCTPTSEEKLPFEGDLLRCCSIIAKPFTEDTGITDLYNGLVIEYIEKLAAMTGFRCSTMKIQKLQGKHVGFEYFLKSIADCSEDGKIRNDSNCKCDIGVAGWFETYSRSFLNVDFVYPFIHDEYGIITHVDWTSPSHNDFFFVTGFSMTVWSCIVALMLLFTCLRLLDQKYYPSHILRRFRLSALDTARIVLGGEPVSANSSPRSTMRRHILNFVVTLSGLFLILIYEATMTASLVSESNETKFKNVENLMRCQIPHEEFGIARGDASETFWASVIAPKPDFDSACPGNNISRPEKFDSYDDLMTALADDKTIKYALLDRATAAGYINGKYCSKLVFTGESFLRRGASIVLPKGSKYTKVFNRNTMLLNEQGQLPTIDGYITDPTCAPPGEQMISFRRLSLFFGLAFAACVFVLLEMMYNRPSGETQSEPAVVNQRVDGRCH